MNGIVIVSDYRIRIVATITHTSTRLTPTLNGNGRKLRRGFCKSANYNIKKWIRFGQTLNKLSNNGGGGSSYRISTWRTVHYSTTLSGNARKSRRGRGQGAN